MNKPMDTFDRVGLRLNTGHKEIMALAAEFSEKTGKPIEECVDDAINAQSGVIMGEIDMLFFLREGEKAQCRHDTK